MKNAVKAKPLVKEQYNEEELEDLRELLLAFNNRRMQQHLDRTIAQKGYATSDFENMLTGHQRKAQ